MFTQYLPQRIFLMQGDEETYRKVCALQDQHTLHALTVARFTMDDARTVATWITEGTGTERILVIYTPVFMPEAAQVLLKSFEEPDMHTVVVLITPYPYAIPQTIRSRVMLLPLENRTVATLEIKKSALLEYVKKEFGTDRVDDAATKRADATRFLDQLEVLVGRDMAKARAIYEAKALLFKANMPTKFVVEYAVTAVL